MADAPTARADPRRASQRGREGAQMREGGRDAETRHAEAERATEAQRGAETHHGRQRQTQTHGRTHPRTHAREERRRSREKGRRGGEDARRLYTAINNRPARNALETASNRATEAHTLRGGVLSLARVEAQNPPENRPEKFFLKMSRNRAKKLLQNQSLCGIMVQTKQKQTKHNTPNTATHRAKEGEKESHQ